jgi:hypothetical protein
MLIVRVEVSISRKLRKIYIFDMSQGLRWEKFEAMRSKSIDSRWSAMQSHETRLSNDTRVMS